MSDTVAALTPSARPAPAGGAPAGSDPATGCPKCGNPEPWGRSSWCPHCGFYPRLGTSVTEVPHGTCPHTVKHVAPKSPLEVWRHTPDWMKVLCLGIAAIFGMSIAIRAITPDKSVIRSLWSTCQLTVGLCVFVMFHLIATLKATFKHHGTSFIDAIVHPFDVWRPTIHDLPATSRRVLMAGWGLTAALSAAVVIGGIRYSVLVEDWGFRQRARSDIAAQIRAKSTEEAIAGGQPADSLEDAVRNAGADGQNAGQEGELEMLSSECVIVGYNVSKIDDSISELVLASVVDGKLKYVGTVQAGLPVDVRRDLETRLPKLKRETPIVKCSTSGVWVKPVIACRTKFKAWTDDKTMSSAVFEELLADVGGG